MSRPGGVTPKGLPYPGSGDVHSRTPAALQALAEAVESKLTAVTPGVILDFFHGVLSVSATGAAYGSFTIPFVNLAAITGWVGSYGIDLGGGLVDGFISCAPGAGGMGYLTAAPWVKGRPPGQITVHAVGWGPPR